MKNTVFVCQIETITPLHVGSGDVYRRGIDFDVQENLLHFYDAAKIHARLAQEGKEAVRKYENELLSERPSVHNFFRAAGWNDREFLRHLLKVSSKFIRDVKGQIKTGLGTPIIPGSSLKGALRTAALADFFDEHPDEEEERLFRLRNRRDKQKAAMPIVQEVFGPDPNHDVMRQLSVSDIAFERDDLDLYEMKVANLTQNGYGFLNMAKKRTEHPESWRYATSIVAEAIKPQVKSQPFTMAFDGFLEEHPEIFKGKSIPLKGKFFGAVDYHYKVLAEREYDFFDKYGLDEAARFYDRNILGREFKNSEVLIRVGWGGGWKFMTGDWLTENQLQQIRREYRLGKREHPVFPKSRRLVVEDNFPQIPLGWAVLHLLKNEE